MAEIKAFHKGKEPAVIANPSPGCNGTLLVHGFQSKVLSISKKPGSPVFNHLSSNHASDANVHGNPYLDTEHHPRYIIQHIEDNSCRSAFVVIIVIEVVVNFSALWCAPCKTTAQAFCELADKYSSVVFLTVDVDELAELSTSWEIKATPTFFFLKDGRQVDKLVGGNMPELQRKTAAIVNLESRSRN
ncbi:thioredoxin H9 [Populus alba x Populus x berolinensis]|uniref:Thioredoxin H9 n=1 Tax=Populus alba x Populus x berolinensis TaxID=444605 RepID=A0AAD6L8E8_9ROSI|nr:thioredoxin H9 [Populus alba x Populus x berolinensis]